MGKQLQFVSHNDLLYVEVVEAGVMSVGRLFILRRVGSGREVHRSTDLYRLREIGDEWIEALSA